MKCPICGVLELPPKDSALACPNCIMTGKQMEFWLTEPVRNNVLGRIRDLPNVVVASLWPSGPSQWMLSIFLEDGRFVTPMAQVGETVNVSVAAIPEKGQPWVAFINTRDDDGEWQTEVNEEGLDDDTLVDFIAGLGG